MKDYQKPTILRNLYCIKRLSTRRIAKKCKVSHHTVLYWLKKYNIPCRLEGRYMDKISKEKLETLYWKEKLSLPKIAKKFNLAYSGLHFKFLKYGISRRTHAETNRMMWKTIGRDISIKMIKHPKIRFSNNLIEKAYMIGLRLGDISTERKSKYSIRVSTGSTHPAQIKMFKEVFNKYGHTSLRIVQNKLGKEWFVRCELDDSFTFLAKNFTSIPKWILRKTNYFYAFLAGFMDSEGCWTIRKGNIYSIGLDFRLFNTNKKIIKQIQSKLEELNFNPHLYHRRLRGSKSSYGISHNKDVYILVILQKNQVIKLARTLLQFSHHEEKIQKMRLVLKTENLEKWDSIKNQVLNLRNRIKESRLNEILGREKLILKTYL